MVDSRLAEEGGAIRRRRECLGCGRRFTTFERVEEVPLWVVKRTGLREALVGSVALFALSAGLAQAQEANFTIPAQSLDQTLRHGTQTSRSLLADTDPAIQAILKAFESPIEDG